MGVKFYGALLVWQKAMPLVEETCKRTTDCPNNEAIGLNNQMRRRVVSIPSRIAEGYSRRHIKEFVQRPPGRPQFRCRTRNSAGANREIESDNHFTSSTVSVRATPVGQCD